MSVEKMDEKVNEPQRVLRQKRGMEMWRWSGYLFSPPSVPRRVEKHEKIEKPVPRRDLLGKM